MTNKQNILRKRNINGWYIVFINAFVGCSIAATFPQFSMTIVQLSEVSGISEEILMASDTVKSIGIVLSMLCSGFLYNKFGARIVFLYALVANALPQFIIPHISSSFALMAYKIFQGTSSVIFPIFLAIIMNWIRRENTGLATAVFNGIFYGGGGIGGSFAGIIITYFGWVESYYFLGIIQIIIAIIWLVTVREKPKATETTENQIIEVHKNNASTAESRAVSIASVEIWLLAITFIVTTWCVQAITVDMPIFAATLGFDELSIGKILTAVTAGIIVSCILSGKISDFFAIRSKNKASTRIYVLMVGHVLIVFSVCLIVLGDMTHFALFYICVFFFTFAAAWGLGTFYSILPEIFDKKTVPIATGITGGIGDTGMPIAPFVVGVIFGSNSHWDIGWLTCAAVALLSLIASFILLKQLNKKKI